MSKKPTNPTSVLEIGSSEWVEYLIEDAMQKHNEAAAAKRKSKVTTPEANNNNSVVKCPSCKKVFISRRGFYLHYSSHLNNEEKYADSSHSRAEKKRRRINTKNGSKKVNANAVDEASSRNKQPQLGSSVHTVNSVFNDSDLTCQLCWVQCSSKKTLYDHMRNHLKGMIETVDRLNQSIICIAATLEEEAKVPEADSVLNVFPD